LAACIVDEVRENGRGQKLMKAWMWGALRASSKWERGGGIPFTWGGKNGKPKGQKGET